MEKKLIKMHEVMEILGIGRTKFYQLAHEPDFPSLKIGRYVYVDRNKLNEWIDKKINTQQEIKLRLQNNE